MDESQEVPSRLVVAGRYTTELLDLLPEAFPQVAILVTLRVDLPLLLACTQRRDHRLRSLGMHEGDHGLTVVALVRDHRFDFRLGRYGIEQRGGMGHIRLLPRT